MQIFPSISTGRTISGFAGGLKLECTNVSSKSSNNVFLPLECGFYGLNAARWGGSASLLNL